MLRFFFSTCNHKNKKTYLFSGKKYFLYCSESITKDQTLLKTLLNQASKYLQNVKISEMKVKQLTEQLAAAEKVANANKDNLEKAKKQVRKVFYISMQAV